MIKELPEVNRDYKNAVQRECKDMESKGYRIVSVNYNNTERFVHPNCSFGTMFVDLGSHIKVY